MASHVGCSSCIGYKVLRLFPTKQQQVEVLKNLAEAYDPEIHEYMKYLASEYPKLASTFSIGKSFEGRDLLVLKITTYKSSKKPIIWIDGGTHAREWITPSSALYIATKLLNDYEIDANVTKLMNPDGYEYSHTTDRMWRKTRSWTISLLGCRGVDPNRNWSFKWN
ncbi:carboxypeptidase B-like, partial [Limulus polyphemus]|uniref:Carboxypeptidase B-like n=1 Tax=Limulus polyphemus TaxID=6850 RepID=A0ABM1SYG8_LIMPO